MSKHKEEVVRFLEEQSRAKRENKLRNWRPYPKQAEFIEATSNYGEVCLRAGNQQGKTETASFFVGASLTGIYPSWFKGRRWDRPIRAWACGESTTAVRDVNQRKLFGPPGDESQLGTGFVPKDCVGKIIVGHGAGGGFDKVLVKHVSGGWSEVTFKSYDQDRGKWQGESIDLLWCDEEPPVEHYEEGLARLIATNGLAISTFTPLHGFGRILKRFNERSPEALRNRCLVAMKLDDALHLQDPERRAALFATFGDNKRSRIDGLPSLGSGAVFDTPLDEILDPIFIRDGQLWHRDMGALDTRGWSWAWSIDFGISHPFAAVLLGHDRDRDIIYVVAEIRMRNATPSQHAQRIKALAVNAPVIWPHDGHVRERGSGLELAKLYKNEGLHMMASHATFPTGGYSTEAGIHELGMRFQSGRLRIAAVCTEIQDEYQNYHRKDGLLVKEGDDLLSALRIGVMAIRNAKPTVIGANPIARRSGVVMARDVDFDLFD